MARYASLPLALTAGAILVASAAAADCVGTAFVGDTAYSVEIAATPASRAQGLMARTELAENAGMLFLFPDEMPRAFWMKNTPLPLDIGFFDAQGQLITQHIGRPYDETPLRSDASAAVLEVNAGRLAQDGALRYEIADDAGCPALAKHHPARKGN